MRLPKLVFVVALSFGASLQVGAQTPTFSDVERRIFELEKRFREIYERDIRTSHALTSIHIQSPQLFPALPDFLQLKRLEKLDFSHCGIGDTELATVGANAESGLKVLMIHFNGRLTDDGIAHLSTMSQLETLVLGKGASGISDAGVEALAKRLPRCDIRR